VAERAGGVGDGVGAAEEVEDAHWVSATRCFWRLKIV
jgi:hypothetical protein